MRSLFPTLTTRLHRSAKHALGVLLSVLLAHSAQAAVTPTGTEITNTVIATYSVNAESFTRSDSASLTTQEVNPGPVVPTPANIRLAHIDDDGTPLTLNGTDYGDGQGNFTPYTGFEDENGNTINFPATVCIPQGTSYKVCAIY